MDMFGSDDLFKVFEEESNAVKLPKKRKLDADENAEKAAENAESIEKQATTEKEHEAPVSIPSEESDVPKQKMTKTAEECNEVNPASESISVSDEVQYNENKSITETENQAVPMSVDDEPQPSTSAASLPSEPQEKHSNDVEMSDSKATENKRAEPDDYDEDEEDVEGASAQNNLESLQKYLPQVEIRSLETPEGSGCTHVVTIPKSNFYYIPLHPVEKPVKTYPFKLDLFQERAVQCVDNYQSVLVSAHTSAGKTVVAEYSIAKGLKDNQRVIYTTPIKALSNQKYREFYEEFKDVGLITGDVTINPSAGCLIMTTEILRNMLYKGSEIMREVGWVIFDEIHYMRDKERGVVWEETIILLPQKTHYVFLSATIPNAVQFSQWITHLHQKPCNVIHTDYRPVPLHHYLYPVGADGIHLIVDEQNNFREEAFKNAIGMIKSEGSGGRKRPVKHRGGGDDSPCHRVIKMAMENNLSPVICFSFSRKDCESYALQLAKLDFNSAKDKQLVDEVFHNAIDVLSKEDQKLPQVENLLPMLKRGIGIHHGGLLPLLKETIEILFGEGLIKVLFATETFAMGLNMPARTVMFTGIRKFDGKDYRWVTSGEYIQMSGRAGRRGIDDKGIAIVMLDEKITPTVCRGLLKGAADPINSAFHLTYNMVLNLMRVEEINPEFMMERSFFQFQNYSSIPAVCEKMMKAEEEYKKIEVPREKEISSYYRLRMELKKLENTFRSYLVKPMYIIPFMQPGRLVRIKSNGMDFGWGAIINFRRQENPKENPMLARDPVYVVEVLLMVSPSGPNADFKSTNDIRPTEIGKRGEPRVVPVFMGAIFDISSVRINMPSDVRSIESRLTVFKTIEEVQRRFPELPLLDPVKDLKIREEGFKRTVKEIKNYEQQLYAHTLHNSKEVAELYAIYSKKQEAYGKVEEARAELKKAKSLLQMDELKCRKRVLRRLGYSTQDDVIQIKGRVACELTSADELLLTEMIFNGVFIDLDVTQTVALLSCLVSDEKSNEVPKLSEELSGVLRKMQDMARQIAKVSKECKMEIDEEDYVAQFKPFLMDVVHSWANGATFAEICSKTDIFEGGIIRCMRRLEELLRQMSLAAKVIGNKELEEKFNKGVKLIKRDIVFAASLYL